jgi:hypothetical protein
MFTNSLKEIEHPLTSTIMDLRSRIRCNNDQKSIYHHWKQNRFSEIYHFPMQYEIKGDLDIELLANAFKQLFLSQFAFGLKFRDGVDNEVVCSYDASCLPALQHHTITGDSISYIDYQLSLYKAKFFLRTFDLNKGKKLHIDLVTNSHTNEHVLLINCHGIICDSSFFDEITALVSRFYNNKAVCLKEDLHVNAKRYLELNQYTMHVNKKDNVFHKSQLSRLTSSSLTCLGLSSENQTAAITKLVIDQDLKQKIENYCHEKNIEPYVFYLGCHQLFLNKAFGKEQLCTGVPVPNRPRKLTTEVVGYFTNTLPVISSMNDETTPDELFYGVNLSLSNLSKNKNADISAVTAQNLPLHKTYDNLFSFHKECMHLNLNQCTIAPVNVAKRHLGCPISMEVKESTDLVEINIIHNSNIYPSVDLGAALQKLIHHLIANVASIIGDIQLDFDREFKLNNNDPLMQSFILLTVRGNDYVGGKFGSIAFQTPEKAA